MKEEETLPTPLMRQHSPPPKPDKEFIGKEKHRLVFCLIIASEFLNEV